MCHDSAIKLRNSTSDGEPMCLFVDIGWGLIQGQNDEIKAVTMMTLVNAWPCQNGGIIIDRHPDGTGCLHADYDNITDNLRLYEIRCPDGSPLKLVLTNMFTGDRS